MPDPVGGIVVAEGERSALRDGGDGGRLPVVARVCARGVGDRGWTLPEGRILDGALRTSLSA